MNSITHNYLENSSSMGIYINLITKPTGRKYVVLKPSIKIVIKDKDIMQHVKNDLSIHSQIKEIKVKTKGLDYTSNLLHLQDDRDIMKFIFLFEKHTFISQKRQGIFDRFLKAYLEISSIGKIHKEYGRNIENFINNYLPIQNNKKGFTNEEWIEKIKKHFEDE